MSIFGIEIGNGWILSLILLADMYVPISLPGKLSKNACLIFPLRVKERKSMAGFMSLLFIVAIVYPLFLTMQFGTLLFYIGLAVYVVSGIATVITFLNYFSTPLDQPIRKGMYKISRNPIYVFASLMIAGIALMCHSVIMGVIVILHFILQHFIILEEEKFCLEKYGEGYKEFKERVPRYLLFF